MVQNQNSVQWGKKAEQPLPPTLTIPSELHLGVKGSMSPSSLHAAAKDTECFSNTSPPPWTSHS